jgi:hypothetical protein
LALATLPGKTEAQQEQQLALAEAFREAACRFELASRGPGGLARSGFLIGLAKEQARLIAEAEAYRKGADDMARGMSRSPFFAGAVPADVVADLRHRAPDFDRAYLNGLALLAGVAHLPYDYLPEAYRDATSRALGASFVAAACAVEQDRWGGRPLLYRGDVAQWDALNAALQGIAGQNVSPRAARSVRSGMYQETWRQFLPDTLSLLAGGPLVPPPARPSASRRTSSTMRAGSWGRRPPEPTPRCFPSGCPRQTTWQRSCRAGRCAIPRPSPIRPRR